MRHLFKFVLCALMVLMASLSVHADTLYPGLIRATSYLNNGGYIEVKFPHYNDDGRDDGLHYDEDSHILVNGSRVVSMWSFQGAGDPQDEGNSYWCSYRLRNTDNIAALEFLGSDNQYHRLTYYDRANIPKEDRYISYSTFRIYPSIDVLRSGDIRIEVKLFVDKNNGSDYWVEQRFSYSYTPPKASVPRVSLSMDKAGCQNVSFNARGSGDTYTFTDPSTGEKVRGRAKEMSEQISHNFAVDNNPRQLTIDHGLKLSAYQEYPVQTTTPVPSYFMPNEFTLLRNEDSDVEVEWAVSADSYDQNNQDTAGKWILERADNEAFDNAVELYSKEIGKKITYRQEWKYVDKTSEANLNGRYYYRIRRSNNQWGNDPAGYVMRYIDLEMGHRYIGEATGYTDGGTAVIQWSWNGGNVWSKDSKVYYVRENVSTDKHESPKALTEEQIKAKTFTDQMPTTCENYRYYIYVQPGSNKYEKQTEVEVVSELPFCHQVMGEVTSLKVSKGYYNDRVDLKWTTDGELVEFFSVMARIHSEDPSKQRPFEQIASVTGNQANNAYLYTDTRAVPGVIYDYCVRPNARCGGEVVTMKGLEDIGFRTPTGEVNGRVTFENGQAVEGVYVTAQADENALSAGHAITLTAEGKMVVNNRSLFGGSGNSGSAGGSDSNSNIDTYSNNFTLQGWFNLASTDGKIFDKDGFFSLYLKDNKLRFDVGRQSVEAPSTMEELVKSQNNFVHITAMASEKALAIYINGELLVKSLRGASSLVKDTDSQLIIGEGLAGIFDEIRLWNIALEEDVILRDYNRYIVGNEKGLVGYYTLDMATGTQFFDSSYSGIEYNENHGVILGGVLQDESIPQTWQLGYRGVTNLDGSYGIRAIPYTGNGTTYMIVPSKGSHSFSAEKELRLISPESSVYTVNFIDNSSFDVKGVITYVGGNVPVEGVEFKVDGKTCIDKKNNIVKSNSRGEFVISVPVGTHEVKAEKAGHKLVNDGRITNSDGTDRNYQDDINGIELKDETTIKLIGRVTGGKVQEKKEVGFGLSTNNLGEAVSLTLRYPNDRYTLRQDTLDEMVGHFNPSFFVEDKPRQNRVVHSGNDVVIYPNIETGEFVAYVIPELYNASLQAPGYEKACEVLAEELDLTNSIAENVAKHEYTDTIKTSDGYTIKKYQESFKYNAVKRYTLRVAPEIELFQISSSDNKQPYFGESTVNILFEDNVKRDVDVYNADEDTYLMGRPVFAMGNRYTLQAEVHEAYRYYDANGDELAEHIVDKVPSEKVKVTFVCEPESKNPVVVEADTLGVARHSFLCGVPDLESGVSSITVTASIDGDASFSWKSPLLTRFITLGNRMKGTDFVTKGPERMLTILRDPPGSDSYSYLEKGATIRSSRHKETGFVSDNNETAINEYDDNLTTVTGPPGAQVMGEIFHTSTDLEFGVVHSLDDRWGGTSESSTTFTTSIQTSSDPDFVGPEADLFVGYSTNLTFGSADNVNIIARGVYEKVGSDDSQFTLLSDVTPADSEFLLVRYAATNISESFSTLFAYPQCYISDMMLPRMRDLRNGMLHHQGEMSDEQFAALATQEGEPVYVSKLEPNDPKYGESNPLENLVKTEFYQDGENYKMYYPAREGVFVDTIRSINNDIQAWVDVLVDNERTKVRADKLIKNFSFQSGANVGYSEEYSYSYTKTHNYEVTAGIRVGKTFETTIKGYGVNFELDETESYVHSEESEDETGNSAKIGFELADGDGFDYFSVDVLKEPDAKEDPVAGADGYVSSFIFRTRGGASMCPYEGAYVTKYFEPGQHVLSEPTLQIEVPKIRLEKTFIDNVPTGEAASVILYLSNSTEMAGGDCIFNLELVDASNPDGLQLTLDGAGIGNGRSIYVPAGETVTKTLLAKKASALNYDNIQLRLVSRCQGDPTAWNQPIEDLATFSVHFTPGATAVNIRRPSQNWVYNLNNPTQEIDGVKRHYMEVRLDGFDTEYDNFHRIMLQYKPSSASEDDWVTLMSFYTDQEVCDQEIEAGHNAQMILSEDKGTISYRWFMDALMDQQYDLRAVGTSMINNIEYSHPSEVYHGLKDMEPLRLFGEPQPANGVLHVGDEIRLNFTKEIAKGYLSTNNFDVTGIRNGAKTDHSVSVSFDGDNDALVSESRRNLSGKNLTVELWVNAPKSQDAVYFSHGTEDNSLEFGITSDNRLYAQIGQTRILSDKAVPMKADEWAHVAMSLDTKGVLMAYYNYDPYIQGVQAPTYNGNGNFSFGANVVNSSSENQSSVDNNPSTNCFQGKIHNARIWDAIIPAVRLKANSLSMLSGTELNLLGYYPMNEGRGELVQDRAHMGHLQMEGAQWSLPQGRAVELNGKDQYVRINTAAVPIDSLMDYTIELWFKASKENNSNGNTNANTNANSTLIANGVGDGTDEKGSFNNFFLGFVDGKLTFRQRGVQAQAEGDFLDDDWHHLALTVSRTSKRGQLVVDGQLNAYFSAENLGAIASTYMSLGARHYFTHDENDNQLEKVDMFFAGNLDEVRLWNYYKSESLIKNSINVQLDGNEVGLLAYYPFEKYIDWQGTKEMQFSLEDSRIVRDIDTPTEDGVFVNGSNIETSVNDHTTIATKLTAPVRGKGEVSKLDYDYVANGDALIITLREDLNRIENTTVAFAVDDVRDVNGNKLVSPVIWTAFIDRNQLKWVDQTSIDLVIYQNWIGKEGLTFSADIINKGGYNINYTIANLPSWLKATPTKGKLNPMETQSISFTITELVNVGSYNELIYLVGDNDVTECLALNITIKGEEPKWEVNSSDYMFSMSVFGKIRIGQKFSTDTDDMLAAFQKDNCVGVAKTTYVEANDMYYALLTIYSNEVTHGDLKFRIWDASTGQQYIAQADRSIRFVNNTVIGDVNNPVIFSTTDAREQTITLNQGWSWISINVDDPSLNDLNKVIGDYPWSEKDFIKSEAVNKSANFYDGQWVGPLKSLDYLNMFHIKSSTVSEIKVVGANIDTQKTQIPIVGADSKGYPRWNYISYHPTIRMDVNRALAGYEASVGDIIKSQTAFAMFSDNLGWVGNLEFMEPGHGYMLKRCAPTATTLQYPASTSRTSDATSSATSTASSRSCEAESDLQPINMPYPGNMTIVAQVVGLDLENGDKLVAYVDGEERANAQITTINDKKDNRVDKTNNDNRELFFITVPGDQKGVLDFGLIRDGQPVALAPQSEEYTTNATLGTVEHPYKINLGVGQDNVSITPCPFHDVLTITVNTTPEAKVNVEILNLKGQRLALYPNCNHAGQVSVQWNGVAQPTGVYMVVVSIDGQSQAYKVIKQ